VPYPCQQLQHRGDFIQAPEGCQHRQHGDTPDNGRGGKDAGSRLVVEVADGREPQRQRPDQLQRRYEQEVCQYLIKQQKKQKYPPLWRKQGTGSIVQGTVDLLLLPELGRESLQDSFNLFFIFTGQFSCAV